MREPKGPPGRPPKRRLSNREFYELHLRNSIQMLSNQLRKKPSGATGSLLLDVLGRLRDLDQEIEKNAVEGIMERLEAMSLRINELEKAQRLRRTSGMDDRRPIGMRVG